MAFTSSEALSWGDVFAKCHGLANTNPDVASKQASSLHCAVLEQVSTIVYLFLISNRDLSSAVRLT